MKRLLLAALMLVSVTTVARAQKRVSCDYAKIKRNQYDSIERTPFLVMTDQVKKQPGRLLIPLANGKYQAFDDVNVDTEFAEYQYMGDIRGTQLAMVRKKQFHDEVYYVLNRKTGAVDLLIGVPVFAENLQDFACLNNPGNESMQQIQVCTIRDNKVVVRGYIWAKENTYLYSIAYKEKNVLYAQDNDGKYWKLNFSLGEE